MEYKFLTRSAILTLKIYLPRLKIVSPNGIATILNIELGASKLAKLSV